MLSTRSARAWTALAVGALTAGLVGIAVSPAGAARPGPGDDGSGGSDPIEGPTTTTRPPTNTTRHFEDFEVTTDSVVATATFRYNGDAGAMTVAWGDGTTTSRCVPGQEGPLHSGCLPDPYASDQPTGVMVFKHRYEAPADGSTSTRAVVGTLDGESKTVSVTVTPRYRVSVSDAQFSPLNHCDSAVESVTEWKLTRVIETSGSEQDWRLDLVTAPGNIVGGELPVFVTLPGSGFSVEVAAGETAEAYYRTHELDPVFDQQLGLAVIPLDPLLGERALDLVIRETFPSPIPPDAVCRAEWLIDVDVNLLTPGLGQGPVAGN